MEKFGIFELLDALSAIVSSEDATEKEEPARPSAGDPAYAPPVYGAAEPQAQKEERAEAVPPAQNEGAFDAFLRRHEKISRKIDRGAK